MIRRVATALMLSTLMTGAAVSKDIAICGESEGYSYFPNAGLLALSSPKYAGKWIEDAISPGRFTLSTGVGDKLDLFFTDASGAVGSATSNGAQVQFVVRSCRYQGARIEFTNGKRPGVERADRSSD